MTPNVEQAIMIHRQMQENDAALKAIDAKERELDQSDSKDWGAYDVLETNREQLYRVGRELADALGSLARQMSTDEKAAYKEARDAAA